MLITVQRIAGEINLAKGDAATPPPLPAKVLKKAAGPEMALPASIARLERAADDHGRRLSSGFRGAGPRTGSRRSGSSAAPLLSQGALGGPGGADVRSTVRTSRGEPLSPSIAGGLEQHFGRSLADVRVHTDRAASDAAKGLSAKAFTLGTHVYFGAGQFRPNTPQGIGLLGHELAHVDQFHRGLSGLGARAKSTGTLIGSDRLERFADDHGRRVAGLTGGARSGAIEAFSVTCSDGVGPASQRTVEAIGHAAIAEASQRLASDRLSGDIDDLRVQFGINLAHSEQQEQHRLADAIVRAARSRANGRRAPRLGETAHLARFVVDSGLFSSKLPGSGRSVADAIILDTEHELVIPPEVETEIRPHENVHPGQTARLEGKGTYEKGATRKPIVEMDPSILALIASEWKRVFNGPASIAEQKGVEIPVKFGDNDQMIVLAAKVLRLPLITGNNAMLGQIEKLRQHPDMDAELRDVQIHHLPATTEINELVARPHVSRANAEYKSIKETGDEDQGHRELKAGNRKGAEAKFGAAVTGYERVKAALLVDLERVKVPPSTPIVDSFLKKVERQIGKVKQLEAKMASLP